MAVKFADGSFRDWDKKLLSEVALFNLSNGCLELPGIDPDTFKLVFPWMRILDPHVMTWVAKAMLLDPKSVYMTVEPLHFELFDIARLVAEPGIRLSVYGPARSGKSTLKQYFAQTIMDTTGILVNTSLWVDEPPQDRMPYYFAVSCLEKTRRFNALPRLQEALDHVRAISPYGFLIWKYDDPSKLYWALCPPEMVAPEKLKVKRFDPVNMNPLLKPMIIIGPSKSGKTMLMKMYQERLLAARSPAPLFKEINVQPDVHKSFFAVSCRGSFTTGIPKLHKVRDFIGDHHPYGFVIYDIDDPSVFYWDEANVEISRDGIAIYP
ncbi:MAG: hypothetical protein P4L69_14575 [Desulfosporosinus sp.]|nr:hypothetical protein [Desulfosporosinus sp.]